MCAQRSLPTLFHCPLPQYLTYQHCSIIYLTNSTPLPSLPTLLHYPAYTNIILLPSLLALPPLPSLPTLFHYPAHQHQSQQYQLTQTILSPSLPTLPNYPAHQHHLHYQLTNITPFLSLPTLYSITQLTNVGTSITQLTNITPISSLIYLMIHAPYQQCPGHYIPSLPTLPPLPMHLPTVPHYQLTMQLTLLHYPAYQHYCITQLTNITQYIYNLLYYLAYWHYLCYPAYR